MKQIDRFLGIMEYLKNDPKGCPWVKAQTHQSLLPHLLEESYETADVIDKGKTGEELRDELGDVLLQVVFHAQIAKGRGDFDFEDVARAVSDKLTRRYPTILGDTPDDSLKTPEDIDRQWEAIKTEERRKKGINPGEESILDEISEALPALVRAGKIKGRAAKAGWEWPDTSMLLDKISEEVRELRDEIEAEKIDKTRVAAELGDLMFLLVDFARWYGIDAEDALRQTNGRFERRFRHMEAGVRSKGKALMEATRAERQALWDEAKGLEK